MRMPGFARFFGCEPVIALRTARLLGRIGAPSLLALAYEVLK
jgi:hypothetical protein